ncbi:putative non-ribosomal peptide synthetase module [Burkholderia pseudomallei]|nr:putative non-ribosomal peptide synthetase module [Burkholderia pseudomallei]
MRPSSTRICAARCPITWCPRTSSCSTRCRATRTARSTARRCPSPRTSRARTRRPTASSRRRSPRSGARCSASSASGAPIISSSWAAIRSRRCGWPRASPSGSRATCRCARCSRRRFSRRTRSASPPPRQRTRRNARAAHRTRPMPTACCRCRPRSAACGSCGARSRTAPRTTFPSRCGCAARSTSMRSPMRSRMRPSATRRCARGSSRGRTARRGSGLRRRGASSCRSSTCAPTRASRTTTRGSPPRSR